VEADSAQNNKCSTGNSNTVRILPVLHKSVFLPPIPHSHTQQKSVGVATGSESTASGSGLINGTAGSFGEFVIQAVDQFGYNVTRGVPIAFFLDIVLC